MADSLEALADKGRRAHDAQEDAKARRARRDSEAQARIAFNVARRSASPIGWAWPNRWGVLGLAIGFAVAIPWPLVNHAWLPYFVLGSAAVPLLIIAGWITSLLGYASEQAWVKSLPFPVIGYLETLGSTAGRVSSMRTAKGTGVRIELLLARRPDPSVRLREIIAGFDSELSFEAQSALLIESVERERATAQMVVAQIEAQPTPTAGLEQWKAQQLEEKRAMVTAIEQRLEALQQGQETVTLVRTNLSFASANSRSTLRYVHRMVRQVLVPLHGKHLLQSVEIDAHPRR